MKLYHIFCIVQAFEAISVCETSSESSRAAVKNINCAVILDSDIIVMGTNMGLYVLELTGIGKNYKFLV